MMITENTRMTFGAHKGKKVKDCPISYLTWVSKNLWDTDLHEFALVAKQITEKRAKELTQDADLEQAADAFLRKHGINPRSL